MKKFIIAAALLLVGSFAFAEQYKDHSLLPGLPGYELYKFKDEGFSEFRQTNIECLDKAKNACNPKYKITTKNEFKEIGFVENREYRLISGNRKFSRLEIFTNYDEALKKIGSIKINSDDYQSMHFLETAGKRFWIRIGQSGSEYYSIDIMQEKGMVQSITAGKFAEEINKQGYVTLNVNFDNNKAIIKDGDKPTLNEVVTLLKNDSGLKLSVDGHTDNVGNATANKTLSQQRAESIVKYLINNGVAVNRLVAKGFGSENPVADNRSEEGRAKNRRVELVKIK